MNELELAEIEAEARVAELRKEEFLDELRSRVEGVELAIPQLSEPIVKLTPSDDIESIKRAVNQIIDILSRN